MYVCIYIYAGIYRYRYHPSSESPLIHSLPHSLRVLELDLELDPKFKPDISDRIYLSIYLSKITYLRLDPRTSGFRFLA
jgi:hypothetical protein